jgi:Leucine Rich repeat
VIREQRALANALNFNNTLSELYLHGNEITKVGASVIADLLRCNISLTKLNLFGNEIFLALRYNPSLKSLNL